MVAYDSYGSAGRGHCQSGKFCYLTRTDAKKATKQAKALGKMNPYHCVCGFWHIGHPGWHQMRQREIADLAQREFDRTIPDNLKEIS